MLAAPSSIAAVYSLAAVGVWGTSDFLGGVGARRANVFLFTAFVHLSGFTAMGFLALMTHARFPDSVSVMWAFAAGSFGGLALIFFYRALSRGNMGLIAPVSAVIGATIPALATAFREGIPGRRHLVGFVLAGIGVWLISRTEQHADRPEGLGAALLAGAGFAGFFMCAHQAGSASPVWVATCSRFASLIVTLVIVISGKHIAAVSRQVLAIAVVAGILDSSGTVFFVRAAQIGRLDDAVVLSSLYPTITVLLARVFLREHFSRGRALGMAAALVAVPMIAG